MLSWFIGWEDWEGNNDNSIATEDDINGNDADAEAGEHACDFLKVPLHQL
jgi:hypothetical protein